MCGASSIIESRLNLIKLTQRTHHATRDDEQIPRQRRALAERRLRGGLSVPRALADESAQQVLALVALLVVRRRVTRGEEEERLYLRSRRRERLRIDNDTPACVACLASCLRASLALVCRFPAPHPISQPVQINSRQSGSCLAGD